VGFRIGLDTMGKKKLPCYYGESNSGRPACGLVTIPSELSY